jgi:hypothetical protein
MSSYYKQINGVKYDRSLYEAAAQMVAGERDGRIGAEDGKKLAAMRYDGPGSTPTETRTMAKIKRDFNVTDAGSEAMSTTSRSLSHLPIQKRRAAIAKILGDVPSGTAKLGSAAQQQQQVGQASQSAQQA